MNAKCYTFYSYKGGSGRTTTLLNTTKHLAEMLGTSKEHPILLVDADLESAGLTYFFNCETKFTARFNCTLHAEAFLNRPREVLTGIVGDNTFGISRERLVPCKSIATRLSRLYHTMEVDELFAEVSLRATTAQIFEGIVSVLEKCEEVKYDPNAMSEDDVYISKNYEASRLFRQLGSVDSKDPDAAAKKRLMIENFLPTDGMVDVSHYFGLPEGSVKFIGADVAYTGKHASINNLTAAANKRVMASECSKQGFSTILFDCGAGVQSSAHVLNHISDVLVYCMRPTLQFVSGTFVQLERYRVPLQDITDHKREKSEDKGLDCEKKSVILLPTAVPYSSEESTNLQYDSFERIARMANNAFSDFVDNTFCSYDKSLKEVSLFKWREHILGTKPVSSNKLIEQMSETIRKSIEPYCSFDSMPDDAKNAYLTYRLLAERLCYNT